ncbi:MAG: metallophosphatase family protein [Syntrophales bacterium]|jgi:putative phosphoesterase|nr:metallophosphatase family protein [Syntrophales bacterium]MCK9527581.1 metallophosphatase family protein [Syntrophales bacterium]MDX9922198.1 metallophosphoesterase family protein [Syntrophales bacterium]
MRLGILSDTHLSAGGEWLEGLVARYFHDVDAILHAGDIVDGSVLDALGGRDVIAVCGNMDPLPLRKTLPAKLVMEINGHRLGLIHGWGSPWGIEERILKEFRKVDCIVFGHTHVAQVERRGDVLLFNPGSPTERRGAAEKSIGILDIGSTIEGAVIALE